VAVCVLPGIGLLLVFAKDLNIMTLGDEKASHLGVETELIKKILFLIASFITGACVSAAGIIGFVGLIIPHFMRRLTGPDHDMLIPASALGGAIFLPLCDTIARTIIAPVELPVGVITGFIGGIFFLLFLIKSGEHKVF
jgi:iron complex transport system permease protein